MKMATEEVKALLAFPEVDHSGLVRVQAQTELGHDGGRSGLGLLGLFPGRAQHHEVVRIADDFSDAGLGPGPVEGVQVDVGKKRGDDPALGSPRDRLGEHPVYQHPCTQPLAEQLQHPTVRHAIADHLEQALMVDLAEEVRDVGLEDELSSSRERHPDGF